MLRKVATSNDEPTIQLVSALQDESPLDGNPGSDTLPRQDAATTRQSPPNRVATLPATPVLRRKRAYSPGQLHKNTTTMVLVYEPDIRAKWLVKRHQPFMTEQQRAAARKLAISFDSRFQQLRRQRAAILEMATDDVDVAQKLLEVKMDIADLVAEVRYAISTQILTPEQRKQAQQSFADELGI